MYNLKIICFHHQTFSSMEDVLASDAFSFSDPLREALVKKRIELSLEAIKMRSEVPARIREKVRENITYTQQKAYRDGQAQQAHLDEVIRAWMTRQNARDVLPKLPATVTFEELLSDESTVKTRVEVINTITGDLQEENQIRTSFDRLQGFAEHYGRNFVSERKLD